MFVRAWRWTRAQIPFLVVVAVVASGFLYLLITSGHWRRSTGVMSAALLLAALLRLVLPDPNAGLLAVRNRWVDTVCYLLLGGLILAVDIRLHG